MIGSGTVPVQAAFDPDGLVPKKRKVAPQPCAILASRFCCASLNSLMKPFSVIFVSLRLYWCQRSLPWFPTYRTSSTVSLFNSRCTPTDQDCTQPIFRFGINAFTEFEGE